MAIVEGITKLELKFLVKKTGDISVPMDNNGEIKKFLFKVSDLSVPDVDDKKANDDFKDIMFEDLIASMEFNEFVIHIFYNDVDVFLGSVYFEVEGREYSFCYFDEYYAYWLNDPIIFIEEEFYGIENETYYFDNYKKEFGIEEENYDFTVFGERPTFYSHAKL
jgi:hypothetical protein